MAWKLMSQKETNGIDSTVFSKHKLQKKGLDLYGNTYETEIQNLFTDCSVANCPEKHSCQL